MFALVSNLFYHKISLSTKVVRQMVRGTMIGTGGKLVKVYVDMVTASGKCRHSRQSLYGEQRMHGAQI